MPAEDHTLNTVSDIDEPAEAEEEAGGFRLSRLCRALMALAMAAAIALLALSLAGGMSPLAGILIACVLIIALLAFAVTVQREVCVPLEAMTREMKNRQTVSPAGVKELRTAMRAYNRIVEASRKKTEVLLYEAMHDRLTGLLNRNAFEIYFRDTDLTHATLLMMDIDDFKRINDTGGHDAGDRALKRVAEVLRHSFRSVDPIYRIGGDEFVVIMTRADSRLRDLILDKVNQVNHVLLQGGENLPPISLSVGVAFCDRENPQGDLLKDADTALYRVKEAGRCGCAVY